MITLLVENIKMAIQALWANKARSFLTVLGVVIGVFAVIMIVAITSGLKEEIVGMVASLGSDVLDIVPTQVDEGGFNFASSPALASFSDSEVQKFEKKVRGFLKAYSPLYDESGRVSYRTLELKSFVIGNLPAYFSMRDKQAAAGKLFTASEVRSAEEVAVLGIEAAEELFGTAGRAVGKTIQIDGKPLRVIGVLEKEELGFGGFNVNEAVYLPASVMPQLFEGAKVREIFVQIKPGDNLSRVKKRLELILREIRPNGEFSIFTQETIMDLVDQITGLITTALAGLAAISLLVGGIGIMNIMLVSVTERTREIGVRKAVGATNRHILTQFLVEAILLCLLGGLIGLLVVAGLSVVVSRYLGFSTLITWQVVVGAVGFSVVVGVIFGLLPAYRAAKKDPVEALSYE